MGIVKVKLPPLKLHNGAHAYYSELSENAVFGMITTKLQLVFISKIDLFENKELLMPLCLSTAYIFLSKSLIDSLD